MMETPIHTASIGGCRSRLSYGFRSRLSCGLFIAAAMFLAFSGKAGGQALPDQEQVIHEEAISLLPGAVEVQLGVSYRRWSIKQDLGDFSIHQLVLPAHVRTMLGNDIDFSCLFHVANSDLELGPSEVNRISGITDGKLALTYFFPDRRFSAGLGLRVPTGKSRLDQEENTVVRELAERIFGFRVKRYGEGTDIEARGGYATVFDHGLAVSAGAAYLVKGNFTIRDPVDDGQSMYQPGNELSLLATARGRVLARDWSGRLQLTTFDTDLQDGVKEIDEGNEVALELRAVEERLAGVIELEAGALWKGETEVLSAGGVPPARDVGGNILRIGGEIHSRIDRQSELGGGAGLSWYGETDRGVGDGLVVEAGPRFQRTFGAGLNLSAGYTFFFGKAEDGTIDLRGHDLALAVGLGRVEAFRPGRKAR